MIRKSLVIVGCVAALSGCAGASNGAQAPDGGAPLSSVLTTQVSTPNQNYVMGDSVAMPSIDVLWKRTTFVVLASVAERGDAKGEGLVIVPVTYTVREVFKGSGPDSVIIAKLVGAKSMPTDEGPSQKMIDSQLPPVGSTEVLFLSELPPESPEPPITHAVQRQFAVGSDGILTDVTLSDGPNPELQASVGKTLDEFKKNVVRVQEP